MSHPTLPDAFTAQMQTQLGAEYPAFEAALAQPAPVSIRLNPNKPGFDSRGLAQVPWCTNGFYLPERPNFTLDPLFQAGAYYVQEASSMFIQEAIRQTVRLNRPLQVLDLCAAPGGKSTLLASLLSADSVLVSNEVVRSRVPVLRQNLDKWGNPNIVVSHHDPDEFSKLSGFFDIVLVDAPCSGEGLFRKDPNAIAEWSEANVQLCRARQKRIVSAAANLVDTGGVLLYSTCTYNDAENLHNVQFLTEQGFRCRRLDMPSDWGIVERNANDAVGYQCYPHRVQGEGFFLSVLEKTAVTPPFRTQARTFRSLKPLRPREAAAAAEWLAAPSDFSFWQKPNGDVVALPKSIEKQMLALDNALYQKGLGLEMGQFKGSDFIPAHALALSTAIRADWPALALSREDALRFFKKENPQPPRPLRGWHLAQFDGLNLGWLKGIGNRINNYLPNDWRIRMDIREYV